MTLRTRIFLVFVLLVASGFFFLVRWIADDLRPRYLESLEEPLVDTAHLLAELLAAHFDGDSFTAGDLDQILERVHQRRFQARIYALDKQQVDMRIYVTNAQGQVVFDSSGVDLGADYSRWNDVARTLDGRYGARSTAEDPTYPDRSTLYIAAPILQNQRLVGVVSVGKSAQNVDRFIGMAQQKFIIAGITAAVVVLVLGLVLTAWISRPLAQLIAYAQAVQAGERVSLPRLGRNEIGMMGAAMEEMRQTLAGKDYVQRYVQTLTHELKSPLAAIRGAAELLGEDMPPPQRRRFLGNIRTEVQRLQELVERMLDLAALEQRQGLERVERIPLLALVHEVVSSLVPLSTLRGVAINSSGLDGLAIQGERFLIRQALANLIRNALEFSPPGGQVTIHATLTAEQIILQIHNQGAGIPDFALARLFERFFSLPRPDGSPKSTGLGLPFVREVAELHGGTIQLCNHPEDGVEACLYLPYSHPP